VVFRHYESADRAKLAAHCRLLAKDQGRVFLIAGDEKLARDVKADGLHLPEHLAHCARRLRQRRPLWTLTLAVHSFWAMRKAQTADLDALMVSPVFPTPSHPTRPSLGPLKLANWTQASRHPLYALGGVSAQTIIRLKGSGIHGIAAIGGLMRETR